MQMQWVSTWGHGVGPSGGVCRSRIAGGRGNFRRGRRLRHRCTTRACVPSGGGSAGDPALGEAVRTLREFNTNDVQRKKQPLLASSYGREILRNAVVKCVREARGPLIMGVCAPDSRSAVKSLRMYAAGLGLEIPMPECRVKGVSHVAQVTTGMYIKYNQENGVCFATSYDGDFKGILLTLAHPAGDACEGPELETQQFAHLPLDLWPPP